MSKQLRGSLILLIASVIWGFAFVAQSEGMNSVGPFTFQATRMILAFMVLCPAAAIIHGVRKKKGIVPHAFFTPKLIGSAVISGIFLFIAAALQQVGMLYTSVGHAGFLTALYLLMVPILLGVLFKKKISPRIWVCVGIALVGLWFLCMTSEGFSMGIGDLMMLGAALFFSFQIMSLDFLAKDFDGVQYSAIQMLTAGLLSLVCTFIFETPTVEGICAAALPIAYAGIMSCGVAYTFQIIGQRDTPPTVASIIMSLESVFAVLGGALLLAQIPSVFEFIGCGLMLVATVISQLGGEGE